MEEREWLCTTCEVRGRLHYIDLKDVVSTPDITITPAHNRASKFCNELNILLKAGGKVLRAMGTRTGTSVREPYPMITAEDILGLHMRHPAGRVVIVECVSCNPRLLAENLFELYPGIKNKEGLLLHKGVPLYKDRDYLHSFFDSAFRKSQTVVFIGSPGDFQRWERLRICWGSKYPFDKNSLNYFV